MRDFLYTIQQNDVVLQQFLDDSGHIIYIMLFFIIYLKTAFVVLTFLPGDATAFIGGALVTLGELNLFLLVPLLFAATVLGDTQNHLLGRVGKRVTVKRVAISFTKLQTAREYFEKYGGKAIIFARFVPLMRTTIPFVTGYMQVSIKTFVSFNSIGAIIWVILWVSAGMLLGQMPLIKEHMSISLPLISLLPVIVPLIFYGIRFVKKQRLNTEI